MITKLSTVGQAGFGLGSAEDTKTPCIGVELTKTEYEQLKGKKLVVYQSDGKDFFDVYKKGTKLTNGKGIFYILFLDK